jgi:hypothetical protein
VTVNEKRATASGKKRASSKFEPPGILMPCMALAHTRQISTYAAAVVVLIARGKGGVNIERKRMQWADREENALSLVRVTRSYTAPAQEGEIADQLYVAVAGVLTTL